MTIHDLRRTVPASVLAAALALGVAGLSAAQSDEADRVRESARILDEIITAPDGGVPQSILESADGLAVFPSTIKGAFLLGAQRGKGIIVSRDMKTGDWSAPAFLTLTGGSVGLQIGGQATDIVLVIVNDRGIEKLAENSFTIGAGASVAAGPVGRDTTAATDYTFRAEILSYSRTRGVFAGVSLEGATIRADRDANERLYGIGYNTRQIILEQRTNKPDPVPTLITSLERLVPFKSDSPSQP